MAKYDALTDRLMHASADSVTLGFDELDSLVGACIGAAVPSVVGQRPRLSGPGQSLAGLGLARRHCRPIVDLRTSPALAQVSQDTWLTMTDPRDYAQTRHWGHWIRTHTPTAAGYVWYSRREAVTEAFVLFADRVAAGTITNDPSHPDLPKPAERDFDTPQGKRHLRHRLW